MGRNGFLGAFQGMDAFGKTMEDVKIRTRTGAFLTLVSFSIILASVMIEFIDYRRIRIEPSIVVDRSRGEKLVIEMDVSFPRVPCSLLSIDVMDISGERQSDLTHNIMKTRLSPDGQEIASEKVGQLKGDAERAAVGKDPNYCGSCYGATPPESGCCNTCDEVREAYVRQGWSFHDPDSMEQCVSEGWTEKMVAQNAEGCRVAGRILVNKVIGNVQFSHGATFMRHGMNIHELVPYLKGNQHHDFGHTIHKWHFAHDHAEKVKDEMERREDKFRRQLAIVDPLSSTDNHRQNENGNYMFQYFTKVVSTSFVQLNGDEIPSNQYSATQFERDLSHGMMPTRDERGHVTTHSTTPIPGLFVNYEISPMKVIHMETRQPFAHFVTSTCAIIGGVLTVASLIDAAIFTGSKRLKGKEFDGFGGAAGKMM